MARLPLFAANLMNEPWLVSQDYANVVLGVLGDRLEIEASAPDPQRVNAHMRPARMIQVDKGRKIAVVPIVGAMIPRGEGLNPDSGATSYTAIQRSITSVIQAHEPKGIILDWDSPGGAVNGIVETGRFLKSLSAEIPVWSVANSLMASAAYWGASQTSAVFGVPLSNIGSIGVVTSHVDVSAKMEKDGVRVTHLYRGAHKVDGNPFGPLSKEAQAAIEARLDTIYSAFVDAVATGRRLTPEAVRKTEAAVYGPDEAKKKGLIDGIGTMAEVIEAMAQKIALR